MFKFDIVLDEDQKSIINNAIGSYRYVYNITLTYLIDSYKNNKIIEICDLDKIIEENSFLENIDYISLIYSQKEALFNFLKKLELEIGIKNSEKTSLYKVLSDNNIDIDNIRFKFKKKNDKLKYYILSNIYEDFSIKNERITLPLIPSELLCVIKEDEEKILNEIDITEIEIQNYEEKYSIVVFTKEDKLYNLKHNQAGLINNFGKITKIKKLNYGNKNYIGISRSLDDFAVLSTGIRIPFDDSLRSVRKKYFRENIKLKNKIYGSLGSKKNIEENLNFQNRKKILENINSKLEVKYRDFIDIISDQLSEVFDLIFIEDIECMENIDDNKFESIENFIEKEVNVSLIKQEKLEEKKSKKRKEKNKNTIDDMFWRLFIVKLDRAMSQKNKSLKRISVEPIKNIELNEFERYQRGKATGGKRGQIFNREQRILKKKKSESKYKFYSNPNRARRIILEGIQTK